MEIIRPGYNDLLTWCMNNGTKGQLLIDEWYQDKNYNEYGMPIVMQEIYYSHHRTKYWWKCKRCGNEFKMTPVSRTLKGQGCSICGHKRGGIKNHRNALENGNDLYSWCKENGVLGKKIIDEWDTRTNMDLLGIGIADVSSGYGKKVYWICSHCGEKFQCSVSHRTIYRTGCKHCNKNGTSFPEQVIYRALKQLYPDTLNRGKVFDKIEYDICIPSRKICIEYSGVFWHRNHEQRDDMKRDLCNQYHLRFIQIYAGNEGDEWEAYNDLIKYRISYSKHLSQIHKIIDYIVSSLGHSMFEIDFDKAVDDANKFMYGEVENNITTTHPQLCKEWDFENNQNLKPEYFTAGSRRLINWKCCNCGRQWEVSIKSRTKFKSGCSYCGYNIFDGKIHDKARNRKHVIMPGAYSL